MNNPSTTKSIISTLSRRATKLKLRRCKMVIYTVVLLLTLVSPVLSENVFFVADDMDAAPYISADKDKKPVGIFYDIIESALMRMGVPLRYEVFPWKRAQLLVQHKQADALVTIPTPARLEYLVPSKEPVFTMKYKIFTQRDNPNIAQISSIKSLADLKGLIIIDYIGDGWAEKNLSQFGVDWSPNLSSACKKIAAYRGDVFLQDEIMVLHAIKNIKKKGVYQESQFDNIISFDAPVSQIGFHLLIHKDSKFLKLLSEFDETIRAMHKDGEFEKIRGRWIR